MPKLIGVAFMALPVVLALVFLLVWRTHRRIARSVATVPAGWCTTQAVVVDEQTRYDRSFGAGYDEHGPVFVRTPIVRFAGPDGREVIARSQVEGTFMPRRGAVITIHYDPRDPRRARVAADSLPRANRVGPAVVGTIGLVIFVLFAALFEFLGYLVVSA